MSTVAQLPSTFRVHGIRGSKGTVGRVHFKYNRYNLDAGDRAVLDAIVTTYAQHIMWKGIRFGIYGFADSSGNPAYNRRLAARRANAVARYLTDRLGSMENFRPIVQSIGDVEATGKDAFDRRVDIASSWTPERRPIVLDRVNVRGQHTGRLSNRFKFRVLMGSGVSTGIKKGLGKSAVRNGVRQVIRQGIKGAASLKPGIGVNYITVQIKNCRTGEVGTFSYKAITFGVMFGINRTTPWVEKKLPVWLDVADFVGWGRMSTLSYGADSGSVWEFWGPESRKKTTKPIKLIFTGSDWNVGASIDIIGRWKRKL